MTVLEVMLAALVMAVGATVQGSVGFGVNLVAAPLLVLIDPRFVPVPTILASVVLNLLVVRRERAPIDRTELRVAIGGLVPGVVAGALVVRLVTERALGLVFAGFVLIAVGLTASGVHVRPSRRALASAGFASGLMGTAASIGGPPMAVLHNRSEGPVIRATLARFFLVAGLISLTVLATVGEVGAAEIGRAAILIPGLLAGFALSTRGATLLDRGYTRPAILVLCSVSAVAVAVTALT